MYNLTRVYGNFAALCPSFNQKKRRGSSAVQVRMGREEHRSVNGLTIKHSYVVLMFRGSFAARILYSPALETWWLNVAWWWCDSAHPVVY